MTSPDVGSSSAPNRWSSVDLPLPLGPVIATYSPASIFSETLVRAWTATSSYVRLALTTCSRCISAADLRVRPFCTKSLLVTQRFDRRDARGVDRRVQGAGNPGNDRDQEARD